MVGAAGSTEVELETLKTENEELELMKIAVLGNFAGDLLRYGGSVPSGLPWELPGLHAEELEGAAESQPQPETVETLKLRNAELEEGLGIVCAAYDSYKSRIQGAEEPQPGSIEEAAPEAVVSGEAGAHAGAVQPAVSRVNLGQVPQPQPVGESSEKAGAPKSTGGNPSVGAASSPKMQSGKRKSCAKGKEEAKKNKSLITNYYSKTKGAAEAPQRMVAEQPQLDGGAPTAAAVPAAGRVPPVPGSDEHARGLFDPKSSPFPIGVSYLQGLEAGGGVGVMFFGSAMRNDPVDTLRRVGLGMTNRCKLHPVAGFADIQLRVLCVRALHFPARPDGWEQKQKPPKSTWEKAREARIAANETQFGFYWLEAKAPAWAADKLPNCVFLPIGALISRHRLLCGHLRWEEVGPEIAKECRAAAMGKGRLEVVLGKLKQVLFDDAGNLRKGMSEAAVLVEIHDPPRGRGAGVSPFDTLVQEAVKVMADKQTQGKTHTMETEYDYVPVEKIVIHPPGSLLIRSINTSINIA